MYKIILPNFEGPLDLLLYFINRDEINIYDIPITKITKEFLKYIRLMQLFDLELAGEFIAMAATLIYIKLEMLLPKNESGENTTAEDPRTQLVQHLLEYKQIKYAARDLALLAENQRYNYYRNLFDAQQQSIDIAGYFSNSSLFDLISAFRKIRQRTMKSPGNHIVQMITVSVEEKTKEIYLMLSKIKRISFSKLVKGQPKLHLIVSFLAILELVKSEKIFLRQKDTFGEIIVGLKPTIIN